MTNSDEINKIKTPIIKEERPIYYLINENNLDDIKEKSIIADITFTLFSIFISLVISYKNLIYGIIFLIFSIFFWKSKSKSIKQTKKSDEIDSLEFKKRSK